MRFIKFSLITLILTSSALFAFSDADCLKGNFSSEIEHKTKPFGLFKRELAIEKNGCLLTFTQTRYFFVKSSWALDLCRWPVHIKKGRGAIDVLKRDGNCKTMKKSTIYCYNLNELEQIIEDDGLVFAEGDRDDLDSSHGKAFCSFLLMKSYLESGLLFSSSSEHEQVLSRGTVLQTSEIKKTTSEIILPLVK